MKKKTARLLSLLLCAAMLLGILTAAPVYAEGEAALAQIVESGTCGENLTWTLDDAGTLTISGTGEMGDYYYGAPWGAFTDQIIAINMEYGVTSIGDHAFRDCGSLTSLVIPDSVTSIGDEAFSFCSSLTSIVIPDSVTSIGYFAFNCCTILTSIEIPDSVISIGANAFGACSRLTAVIVGAGNLNYSSHDGVLFNKNRTKLIQCPAGKEGTYVIPDGVTSIGGSAFSFCSSLTSIVIPDSVASIGDSAFSYCSSLTSIEIPDSVASIGGGAFSGCSSLTSIVIPDGVTSIGGAAFSGCSSLTSIVIPDSVTLIGDYVFWECNNLTDVYYSGTEADRNAMEIGSDNECLLNATWHYGSTGPDDTNFSGTFFYLGAGDEIHEYTYDYDESWFQESSYTYQHPLARMSLRVAMAAGDVSAVGSTNGDVNIRKLMEELGFDVFTSYPKPDYDMIGYAIGSKEIQDDGEDCTLIMVAVRGSGYKKEWGGNFRIGVFDDPHEGFQLAADQVLSGIENYINANSASLHPRIKVWISGFSRAAATTNLVAASLDDGAITGVAPEDVYAFCFECPQNTTSKSAKNAIYNNIVNVINPIDLVTKVAMSKWEFKRYGRDYNLPSSSSTAAYYEYKMKMEKEYANILKYGGTALAKPIEEYTKEIPGQQEALNDLMDDVALYAKNRGYYWYNYQDGVIVAVGEAMGNGVHFNNIGEIILGIPALKVLLAAGAKYTLIDGNDLKAIGFNAHYMELCMAWMDSIEELVYIGPLFHHDARHIFINCPVDVMVYQNDVLVGKIIDDAPLSVENGIGTYIDGNGQKVIVLPMDETYRVELIATGEGKMTVTVAEQNIDTQETKRVVSYQEIPISVGDKLEQSQKMPQMVQRLSIR